jgi:hypothetical protein
LSDSEVKSLEDCLAILGEDGSIRIVNLVRIVVEAGEVYLHD